jgi:2-oxo-3-hexenedioate decarboxylase
MKLPHREEHYNYVKSLHVAARTGDPTEMITTRMGVFSLVDAYDMQRSLIALRLEEGEKLIGMKMGLTSRAKMEQVGVHEPIYGHLTDAMELENGGILRHAAHCHPRVEPEIAFRLKSDIRGPIRAEDIDEHIDAVCSAMEIIDSRYKNFKFTLTDVIADNASSSRFVLSPTWISWEGQQINNVKIELIRNGKTEQSGHSSAILDHPVNSLVALANSLVERGESLRQGMVVLAGAATAAIELQPGDRIEMRANDWPTPEFSVD